MLSCHSLEIERGSHYNIESDKRNCRVCRDIIEDEYHFLLICPYYKDIRDQYLPAKYILNPNLHKFNILMSSEKISNDQELIQLDPTSCPQNQTGNN